MNPQLLFRVRVVKLLLATLSSVVMLLGIAVFLRGNAIAGFIRSTAGAAISYASVLFAVPLVARLWPPRTPKP